MCVGVHNSPFVCECVCVYDLPLVCESVCVYDSQIVCVNVCAHSLLFLLTQPYLAILFPMLLFDSQPEVT